MSWFTKLIGSVSGNVAEVDATNNLKVNLPTVTSQAGYARLTDVYGHAPAVSAEGRLSVGVDRLMFRDTVDGSVVDTNRWVQSQLTMTQAISSGFLTLNSSASTAINTYSIISSTKQPPMGAPYGTRISWYLKTPNIPQANATMEVGLGFVATTAAPTTSGAYFRWKTDGTFIVAVNWSGTEAQSSALSIPSINVVHLFEIHINRESVEFYVDNALVATMLPAGNALPFVPTHIPLFARVYTAGVIPSVAPQLFVALASAETMDTVAHMSWQDMLAGMWQGANQSPVTPFVATANHANSTSPVSATLSNTAAGYTTLGGRYQFAAPAGAATDFALFGFQVPVGYQLFIDSVDITSINTGAPVAITATILDWAIAVGSSAVSLATAEAPPATWGPKRTSLGLQGFLMSAGIGQGAADITRLFNTPLVCDSGRFVHIIVQVPVGTATASQVIRGDVVIIGRFV